MCDHANSSVLTYYSEVPEGTNVLIFNIHLQIIETKTPKKKKGQAGFNYTHITIAGHNNYAGNIVIARAQNEIYAVLNNDLTNKKMYACAPDIISMVDPITGKLNCTDVI